MEANALSNPDDDWQKTFPDGIKISEIFERSYRSTTSNSDTKGWSPDSKVQEEIDQKLKDPTTKGKIERSIRNRKRKEESRQESPEFRGTAFAGLRAKDKKNQGEKDQEQEQSPDPQIKSAFSTSPVYPLRDSFIMDSGSDFHICNNSVRFTEGTYKSCDEPEAAFSADTLLEIHGYGDVLIRIGSSDKFRLQNVAYIPNFHTNVASLDLFLKEDTIGTLQQALSQETERRSFAQRGDFASLSSNTTKSITNRTPSRQLPSLHPRSRDPSPLQKPYGGTNA
ncbi:uncharacterized protein HRG_06628 [Hirsutella rhossiliensis]|uniref:Retrovirus-related Pol polyprotein from transposon TNT 1-94-like beta-barrel domain-containing protein n=1 Tax=Hirsutella rhossiliensis TaxID=111463 RepID=A0A9P8SIZ4_9HYPO|nr:uncharacterized protein HRG_06628 [Hirsutella rhossiliensis]KAH0962526.1 hypothetical protein HRG_06628 [Hirsutella rhossiliensis]